MPWAIRMRSPRSITLAAGSLAFALCFAALYWHTANLQSPRNYNIRSHNQDAYLWFARRAYESGLTFTGTRNRMPLYPFFQALFYSPDLDEETYFQQGKQRNIVLSLLCLLALGIASFRKFSRIYALYIMLFIAFIVFAIKAPYFQAEILFYTLFAFAFIASADAIAAPRWHKPLAVGALFALAHLTKASAMPGLFIFAGSYALPLLVQLSSRSLDRASLRQTLYRALTPIVVFMLILTPYFAESAARYKTPFYNVNTTFYMWFDSWDEAKAWSNAVNDRGGYPDLPADEIPSWRKYLREHSWRQVADRLARGFSTIVESACHGSWGIPKFVYGTCSQVGLSLLLLALALPAAIWRMRRQHGWMKLVRDSRAQAALFTFAFLVVYALSFAWYQQLIGHGPRTFLSLAIPLMWAAGLVTHAPAIQSLRFGAGRRQISVFQVVCLLLHLSLAYEIVEVITIDAASMVGGS